MKLTLLKIKLPTSQNALMCSGGIFDFAAKLERLEEVNAELEQPDVWNTPDKAQALGKERSALETVVNTIKKLDQGLEDVDGLLELAIEGEDEQTFNEAVAELDELEQHLAKLEFQRMFSGQHDAADCYIDLQAGSGGTEAQDWTEMLLRMYLRWAESKGFKTELVEVSDGDVAGLKSATVRVSGEYAFGWLRTETGIHRLVTRITAATPLLLRLSFTLRLMIILILRLILQICVSMFIALPAPAVSTLIKRKVRCELHIFRAALWCNVKMVVHSIRIKIKL